MTFPQLTRVSLVFALYALLASCTVNPATGKREFTLISPSQEQAIGAQEHPKLLAAFGGPYEDPQVAAYVAAVGGRMAANSELAEQQFTFTLLDSKIVNAFALPGGYVYISRGLLALMNDEAELASVLGHEVGHVTARHAARRQTQGALGGILGIGVGILTGSGELAQATMQGAQVYLLSYSRGQEFESDDLGLRYMLRAGYDPYGAARMLESLGEQSTLEMRLLGREEAQQVPNWARTHPLTEDRVARALENARATGREAGSLPRNRDAFLAAIDGMVYDDHPDQGVIKGNSFWHPKIGFTFSVPDGFALQNGETSVVAQGPNGAAIVLSMGELQRGQSMSAFIQALWARLSENKGPALSDIQPLTVNGMAAATGVTQLTSQSGTANLRIVGINFDGSQAFYFLMISDARQTASLADDYRRTTYSFRKISQAEAADIKTRRIRVVTVKSGDTVRSLANQMAYEDNQLERFMVLNAIDNANELRAGDKVKLVVYDK